MEKKFRLPKPFAEKWVKALRSGKYNQTEGELLHSAESRLTIANSSFCCLGVAGHICGHKLIELENTGFLLKKAFPLVPIELQGDSETNKLVDVLSTLNDGLGYLMDDMDYVFRNIDKDLHYVRFNFNQIADFIEDNVEFYKPIRTKKDK